jgi:hypothetical protein
MRRRISARPPHRPACRAPCAINGRASTHCVERLSDSVRIDADAVDTQYRKRSLECKPPVVQAAATPPRSLMNCRRLMRLSTANDTRLTRLSEILTALLVTPDAISTGLVSMWGPHFYLYAVIRNYFMLEKYLFVLYFYTEESVFVKRMRA